MEYFEYDVFYCESDEDEKDSTELLKNEDDFGKNGHISVQRTLVDKVDFLYYFHLYE